MWYHIIRWAHAPCRQGRISKQLHCGGGVTSASGVAVGRLSTINITQSPPNNNTTATFTKQHRRQNHHHHRHHRRRHQDLAYLQEVPLPPEADDVLAHVQLLPIQHRTSPPGVEQLGIFPPHGLRSVVIHQILHQRGRAHTHTRTSPRTGDSEVKGNAAKKMLRGSQHTRASSRRRTRKTAACTAGCHTTPQSPVSQPRATPARAGFGLHHTGGLQCMECARTVVAVAREIVLYTAHR